MSYVMPDGASPIPRSFFERIDPGTLSDTVASIDRVLPGGLESITAPLSSEERAVLESLGGVGLADQVETIFSEVGQSLKEADEE